MLDKIIVQFSEVEKQWYARNPSDESLTNQLVVWLQKDTETTNFKLTQNINLKSFIRSYRDAFEKLTNGKIKIEDIDEQLVKYNQARLKKDKKEYSRLEFINHLLREKVLKHILAIELEGVVLSITSNPSSSHLGNGFVHGVGKYIDIWPVLNLITDCDKENNKVLASLFLNFASKPFKFTKTELTKINSKFSKDEFASTCEYFCKFLTGIAMHYIFIESARRLVLIEEAEQFKVGISGEILLVSNTMMVLKLLKDGYLKKLEDAFSPNSECILITKEQVSKLTKTSIHSTLTAIAALGINRVKEKYHKSVLKPGDTVAHMISPNSDEFDPELTDEYKGNSIVINLDNLIKESKESLEFFESNVLETKIDLSSDQLLKIANGSLKHSGLLNEYDLFKKMNDDDLYNLAMSLFDYDHDDSCEVIYEIIEVLKQRKNTDFYNVISENYAQKQASILNM